jgi:hypothetical protein
VKNPGQTRIFVPLIDGDVEPGDIR